jgi:hypothetical protein
MGVSAMNRENQASEMGDFQVEIAVDSRHAT